MATKSRMVVIPPEETGGTLIKVWAVQYDESLQRYVHALDENTYLLAATVARLPCVYGHVALMPDAHWGKGVPIGCVLPTQGAIIPNAVGVDIGCFTGDTEVVLLDGNNYTLKDLSAKDEQFAVYSMNENGKVEVSWATAKKTRKNAELVKVTIDNGEEIKCTPDHEFMLNDGSFKKAEDLKTGDRLMPFYFRYSKEGYTEVFQRKTRSFQRAHWIAARCGLLGDIPSFAGQKTVIHHVDFDPKNNDPTNLRFMGDRDHSSYHRSIVDRNTHWQSDEFEEKRKAALAAKAKTKEGHLYFAERGKKNIVAYMENRPEDFKEAIKDNGKRGSKYLRKYNTSEKGRSKSSEVANRVYTCPHCGEQGKSGFFFANHVNKCTKNDLNNHKVISVEKIDDKEDVYCLTVPGNANFALAAGVFVHNCGMCAWNSGVLVSDLDVRKLMSEWKELIPHGEGKSHEGKADILSEAKFKKEINDLASRHEAMASEHGKFESPPSFEKSVCQLGTLGGGNHFVELQKDANGFAWIMIHSGSRAYGANTAKQHHNVAKALCRKYFSKLETDSLAYLPTESPEGQYYIAAMGIAQDYAFQNRAIMMRAAQYALRDQCHSTNPLSDFINIHHNYAVMENHNGSNVWVHRKGATLARVDTVGIIPGSMTTKSFIVRGKGNKDSLNSCSHGSGRNFSRTEAKRRVRDGVDPSQESQLGKAGVELYGARHATDELGSAYKCVEVIMQNQADLVDIVEELTPVAVLKG